jgi:hypothetical protein
VARSGVDPPYVVYHQGAAADVNGVGGTRILTRDLWVVRTIGTGESSAPYVPIAARVDAVLQGARGVLVDGEVYTCIRERAVTLVQLEQGTIFRYLTGIYRLQARAA